MLRLGVDVVDIDRFRRALVRTPTLARRLFTPGERAYVARQRDPAPRLAARFAVKEATMKALGVGLGAFCFHDVEVVSAAGGEPSLILSGTAAELAARGGARDWRVSISHSDLVALAVVVALFDGDPATGEAVWG